MANELSAEELRLEAELEDIVLGKAKKNAKGKSKKVSKAKKTASKKKAKKAKSTANALKKAQKDLKKARKQLKKLKKANKKLKKKLSKRKGLHAYEDSTESAESPRVVPHYEITYFQAAGGGQSSRL